MPTAARGGLLRYRSSMILRTLRPSEGWSIAVLDVDAMMARLAIQKVGGMPPPGRFGIHYGRAAGYGDENPE